MKNTREKQAKINRVLANKMADQIGDRRTLLDVEMIHQSMSWQIPYRWGFSPEVFKWESLVEYKDSLPEYPINIFSAQPSYKIPTYKEPQSTRNFDKETQIDKKTFFDLLGKSFGRFRGLGSKNYASAGGLFPVVPIVILFEDQYIDGLPKGVYIYDSENYRLMLIEKMNTEKKFEAITKNINSTFPEQVLSNVCFAYAIDIEKSILKYGRRGYRHAIIELGLASECLHLTYQSMSKDFGDCIWSGFNDNALTVACGLSPRLMPITLVQWFGLKAK